MLEVVFGESAAGSLSIAMEKSPPIGGAVSIIFLDNDNCKPTKAEVRKLQQEAEKRERRNWANAIPLDGSREDVISFPLALSVGGIDETGIGHNREKALSLLTGTFPSIANEVVKKTLENTQKNLDTLLEHAGKGEPIRVWASHNPDEICGAYWLMEQLRPIGFENLSVTLVKLPDFEEKPNGTVVQYTGWGEIEPYEWGKMAALGNKLPTNFIRAMANHWKQLQKENAPLRASLNGRLVSAPETLYDSYILRELAEQKEEFLEAEVVGNVLGKYCLGIGDAWVAFRIEQFIKDGLLEPTTEAKQDAPVYHRILRKHSKL